MVWEIALVILLLVLTVLVILLIPTVLSLLKTLAKISTLTDNINRDLPHILQNIDKLTDQASKASERISGAVGDIVEIEQKISNEIKQPVIEVAATLAGILKGLQTFITYFIRKK